MQSSQGLNLMFSKLKYIAFQTINQKINRLRKHKIESSSSKSEEFYKSIYLETIKSYIAQNYQNSKSLRILDGGCGTGKYSVALSKDGHHVTCVDYHQPSLELAKENAKKKRMFP